MERKEGRRKEEGGEEEKNIGGGIGARQINLTPRLDPSSLTDHITPDGFSKRALSKKGQRWKHIIVEGRGEEGVRNCKETKLIYREGG